MFETIIGFEKQKKYFSRLTKEGRLSHAYLFTGPAMIGKSLFAQALIGALNGRDALADPDVRLIAPDTAEGDSHILIEDIRNTRLFLSRTPTQGPYKCVIINDADRLTEEASNALLKVLEEPSGKGILILISAYPKLLLSTIRSRCQEISFQVQSDDDVRASMAREHILAADREMIVELAGGRIGWAIQAAQKGVLAGTKDMIDGFQKALKHGIFERMQYAKKVAETNNPSAYTDVWIRWVRSHGKDPRKTAEALHALLKAHTLLSRPQYNHRLVLENLFIHI